MTFRELDKIIRADGWYLVRSKGSHFQYRHNNKPGTVSIPNHKGDIALGTINSVLKQAGLK
jgi:predicted RNA binding protein YcfA (HicA-like mRNA interferase family)